MSDAFWVFLGVIVNGCVVLLGLLLKHRWDQSERGVIRGEIAENTRLTEGVAEKQDASILAHKAALLQAEEVFKAVNNFQTKEDYLKRQIEMLQSELGRLPRLKVLLVDDNEDDLLLAKRTLIDLNCEVTTAGNGQEAIGLARMQDFQLVLVDHAMPHWDGKYVVKELQRIKPGLPIAILTGSTEGLSEDYGSIPVIKKPLSRADLRRLARG